MEFKYLKKVNILYVEDDSSVREGYLRTLQRCAKEVFTATNGIEGLEVFQKNKDSIDIVVTDINMPKLTGIEMVKKIQEISNDIAIVFTSAHSDSSYLFEALDMQVDGYLLKPVPVKKLMAIIDKISKSITLEKLNKQQEQTIIQMEKMSALGQMIGNIAHQWRQPLSVISTGATGLKLQKEYGTLNDEFFLKTCDTINDNAQYLSKTIDDFRDFIKNKRELVEFQLSDDINSFLHLVEGTINENQLQIVKNIQEDIKITGYPNELIQCFINIFNNSKDALKKIEDRYFFITTYKDDKNIIISFKDNAGGIPEEILPHIFEPYFTTKHQSKGTGLGLSMTYNFIVDGMSGSIKANNVNYDYDGKKFTGAEFLITLPVI